MSIPEYLFSNLTVHIDRGHGFPEDCGLVSLEFNLFLRDVQMRTYHAPPDLAPRPRWDYHFSIKEAEVLDYLKDINYDIIVRNQDGELVGTSDIGQIMFLLPKKNRKLNELAVDPIA